MPSELDHSAGYPLSQPVFKTSSRLIGLPLSTPQPMKPPRSKLRGIKGKCILIKLFPLSGNPIASYGESVRL